MTSTKAHSIVVRPDTTVLQQVMTPCCVFVEYHKRTGWYLCNLVLFFKYGVAGDLLNPEIYPRLDEVYVCGVAEDDIAPPDDPSTITPSPGLLLLCICACSCTHSEIFRRLRALTRDVGIALLSPFHCSTGCSTSMLFARSTRLRANDRSNSTHCKRFYCHWTQLLGHPQCTRHRPSSGAAHCTRRQSPS